MPDGVVVLDAGDRSLTRLDTTTRDSGDAPIASWRPGGRAADRRERGIRDQDGPVTTVALRLSGPPRLAILDGNVVDGSLAFELWSGGISAEFPEGSIDGATLTVDDLPGRLLVTITTTKPFASAPISLADGGREVRIALTEPLTDATAPLQLPTDTGPAATDPAATGVTDPTSG